jgi:hypothetical protein
MTKLAAKIQNRVPNKVYSLYNADIMTVHPLNKMAYPRMIWLSIVYLLREKRCYHPMFSSNRFNDLSGIYLIVSSKSAQHILEGYLELPITAFSMYLLYMEDSRRKHIGKLATLNNCK